MGEEKLGRIKQKTGRLSGRCHHQKGISADTHTQCHTLALLMLRDEHYQNNINQDDLKNYIIMAK